MKNKSKKKHEILLFFLVLTLIPLINSASIGNQTITYSTLSNSTIRFEQNTQLTKLIVNNTAIEIYYIVTDNSIFTNINQTFNAQINFYDIPNTWAIVDLTNDNLLFTSTGVGNNQYEVIFAPNVQILVTTTPDVTPPGSGYASKPYPSWPLKLYSINISVEKEWFFDEDYFVYVKPLDEEGEIVELDEIKIEIIENITYKEGEISILSDGSYKNWFKIPKQEINNVTLEEFNIEVLAIQGTKEILEVVEINIREGTFIEKVEEKVENTIIKIWKAILDNLYYIILYLIITIIIGLLVCLFLLFRKRKKNKNKNL